MNIETPSNDLADQQRPARPDLDDLLDDDGAELPGGAEPEVPLSATTEADPADVADQHRIVPLPDDMSWP
jgi:hypothetical protein